MVDLIQSIQEIGFREETAEGISPITVAVPPIHFGLYETTWGKFPEFTQDIQFYFRGQTYDPYRKYLANTSVLGQVSFVPVDGVFWYLANGAASGDGTTHTVTGINSGDIPTFSMRYESSNGTDFHRKDVVGTKPKRLSWTINFLQPDNFMVSNLTYFGKNQINETSLTDNQNIQPIYADGASIDSQNPYRVDSNFSWVWDVGGDNIELKTYGLDFAYILDTMNRVRHVKGQKDVRWITTGNRVHGLGFRILRNGETSIFDDYLLQVSDETFKDMTFKIYNSATTYVKFTFNNVTLTKCVLNHSMMERGEEPYYEVEGLPETVSIEIVDGVNKSFYGDYTV